MVLLRANTKQNSADLTLRRPTAVSIRLIIAVLLCLTAACGPKPLPEVGEPWSGVVQRIVAFAKPEIRQRLMDATETEYQRLLRDARAANGAGGLNQLHLVGIRLIILGYRGRTSAYLDAIATYRKALAIDSSFAPARWGLGWAYYDITIHDLIVRDQMVMTPVGLPVPVPDDEGAELMFQAYREASKAVAGGYGPSDPDVLAMSIDKLRYYCKSGRGKTSKPWFCVEFNSSK